METMQKSTAVHFLSCWKRSPCFLNGLLICPPFRNWEGGAGTQASQPTGGPTQLPPWRHTHIRMPATLRAGGGASHHMSAEQPVVWQQAQLCMWVLSWRSLFQAAPEGWGGIRACPDGAGRCDIGQKHSGLLECSSSFSTDVKPVSDVLTTRRIHCRWELSMRQGPQSILHPEGLMPALWPSVDRAWGLCNLILSCDGFSEYSFLSCTVGSH